MVDLCLCLCLQFLGGIATSKQHEGGASFGGATSTSSEISGGRKPTPRRPPPPPPPPRRPPPPEPKADMELDLKDVSTTKYSNNLIAPLRRQLEDTKQKLFGIPRLRKLSGPEYIYIRFISATKRNSIVIAINKKDIYVQGYTYKNGAEVGARLFKDVFNSKEKDKIFAKFATGKPQNIGYDGSYDELQRTARVGTGDANRRNVALGMGELGNFIDKISETLPSRIPQDEAKLLLIVIQMVSEAARFTYIENQVIANINKEKFTPDYKVVTLETAWGRLSKAIAGANPNTGDFGKDNDGKQKTVKLLDPAGNEWVVTNVYEVKEDIALLTPVRASELPTWPLDDNVPVLATM
ncbi:hypothetical protein Cgig2_016786 [Carnegiea gigantea]|uniref:rRNA N-glycosylase n=1 Tax=Carnegiea gigantea TaxID=171969 RepID=A0A9Q1GQB0_9CARY|nr:hypothetical protein Cgig2_020979 [Carnegiea gigantea]KAJ8428200.1 hypothetical protein Cgig2_016784 [Carnegiea gigantea]KAJ8428202.1 hypothetical protein Cgig2_016786 [Carnegiea gigantea]